MEDDFNKLPIEQRDLTIDAPLNWTLAGTLLTPTTASKRKNSPAILISSAAGVPRGFYTNFARHLVQLGAVAVLIYDYRGMGDSAGTKKRWPELRMFHWAQHDFSACAHWLREKFPNNPMVGVGHSFGGQALGLSGVAHLFDRYATVASMSGYWRGLDTPYKVWFQTQIIGRAMANIFGYIPKAVSPGGAVFPGTIMLDWANWIAEPEYWFDQNDVPGLDNFAKVTLPFLSIRATDDPWGTESAIAAFMKHYTSARMKHISVAPGESGKIGHLGFFRQRHRESHWKVATDFLFNEQSD